MPFVSDAQQHIKTAYTEGAAAALERLGFKRASEELRLKIPRREFHGWDQAHREKSKKADCLAAPPAAADGNSGTADGLAELIDQLGDPQTTATPTLARDPLDRSTMWGAPANLAGGDAAGRISDMGQPTSIGMV